MDATDGPAVIKLGLDDAMAGLVLSTEAHWNQTEEDWRIFLRDGVVFGIRDRRAAGRDGRAAALLRQQRLDQHGAGDGQPSPARSRHAPRRCLPGDRAQERPDQLARCHAGRGRRLRAARLHADAAIAPAEAGEVDARPQRHHRHPRRIDALRARDRRATGLDRTALLSAFARRSGSRIVSANGAIALVRDGRTARHIGPLFADDAAAALTLVDAIVAIRDRTAADRCRRLAGRVPGRIDRIGLDHRAAVPAHAVRPRHRRG